MKPILYEIRRVITSKSSLLLLVLMVAIPALIAVSAASGNSSPSVFINSVAYGYGSNGTYSASIFLYNNYGSPVSGDTVTLYVGQNSSNVTTGSNGFANKTLTGLTDQELGISLPNQTGNGISYTYQQGTYAGTLSRSIPMYQNQTDPYFTNTTIEGYGPKGSINTTYSYSRYFLSTVNVKNSPSLSALMVTYVGAGVKGSHEVFLYYKAMSNSSGSFEGGGSIVYVNGKSTNLNGILGYYPESEMQFYGSYQSSVLSVIVPRNLTLNTNTTIYTFELFSSNGTELAWLETQLVNYYSAGSANQLFFLSELPILTIFVPLMAVLSSYQTYGKDRATGALASVIVRPISRRALIISRFTSNVASVAAASGIALAISSLIFEFYRGAYIPIGTLALAMWSLLVMAAAFIGLVYLASTFLKSSGAIIGIALGLFFVLDIFWSFPFPLLPLMFSSFLFRATPGTLAYAVAMSRINYFSPAGFSLLISALISPSYNYYSGGLYTAAQLGITVTTVVAAGFAWILAPFLIALVRFTTHD